MTRVRRLDSAPNTAISLGRAALSMVPGASNLPFVGGGGGDLPDLELRLDGLEVERDHLRRYNEVCGFEGTGDTLPATFVHVLAFPLQMALVTDGSFPFPAVGLVHINNRITQHRPIDASERLDVTVTGRDLRPHPKGKQFDMLTEVRSSDDLVWEGLSTTLRRGGGSGDSKSGDAGARQDPPELTETWEVQSGLGRRYAEVSGDRNPIHMSDLTAKPLGFRQAIIHGMWTKARSLAALQPAAPDAFVIDVAFKLPIFIPSTVRFGAEPEFGGGEKAAVRFTVRDAAKGLPHLDGTLTPL